MACMFISQQGEGLSFQGKTVDFGCCVLTLYAANEGLLAAAFAGQEDEGLAYIHRYFPGSTLTGDENPLLYKAAVQLFEYFAGRRRVFDLPFFLSGSAFMQDVFRALSAVQYGQSCTYGSIAAAIQQPKARTAVGLALQKNPLPLFLPCHRVNAREGQVSGYKGGAQLKKVLASLEAEPLQAHGVPSERERNAPLETDYIYSLLARRSNPFEALREESERDYIPITKEDTLAFLTGLLLSLQGKRVLEVGTAAGYAALHFWKKGAAVTTIERDAVRAAAARQNFSKHEADIMLFEGDAGEILPGLTGTFDLIYVDAAKGQYGKFLPLCKALCRRGSILIFDNVLFKGLTEKGAEVPHKHRTIARNLDVFLTGAMLDTDFHPAIVPLGDGLLVMVRAE